MQTKTFMHHNFNIASKVVADGTIPSRSSGFHSLVVDSNVTTSARNVLIVVDHEDKCRPDYSRDKLNIGHSTLESAFQKVITFKPDVIFISDKFDNYQDERIVELKKIADRSCIPFILHSSKFNPVARQIALECKFDEYHFGNITPSFEKQINFLQRIKHYRRQQHPRIKYATNNDPLIKPWSLKRICDIMFSLTGLLLLSPLMIIIAIIIKLDSKGPIFYISRRAGSGYKIFDFYKFRSMRVGADAEMKMLAFMNQYAQEAAGSAGSSVFYKFKNDPRVTKFGRFLRDTSLDELPQLFNVLKGDMSLIGNRPLPLYEAERLTADRIAGRFLAPAGISGLWQVSKRGREKMSEEERIDLDIQYAKNSSFLYDVKILLSTFPALLQKEKV